jgi:SAM-dependent methyltransferase
MKRKLDVAALLKARSPVNAPIFPVLEKERKEALRFVEEHSIDQDQMIAAVNPGGTAAGKRWPVECYSEAGKWLTDNLGATVLVLDGPDNGDLAREVCSSVGNGRIVPLNNVSLGAVAALLERCSLFLTNDSGPMHLAAALGVPTVGIFGQTNHARYLPLLPESRRELAFADPDLCSEDWEGSELDECKKKDCRKPDCIRAVTVDEVISKMESLCSRIGFLYSTHLYCSLRAQSEDEVRDTGGDIEREDSGYITKSARRLSQELIRDAEGPILDAACGKGYLLSGLAAEPSAKQDLWGVDISMGQLRAARSHLWQRVGSNGNGRPRLVAGDLAILPFRSESFSTSLCVNTLLNLPGNGSLKGFIAEIARVTKPGGRVYVEVRNPMNPLVLLRFLFGRMFRGIPLRVHKIKDIIEAGSRAGLSLCSREPVGPVRGLLAYSYVLVFSKEGR